MECELLLAVGSIGAVGIALVLLVALTLVFVRLDVWLWFHPLVYLFGGADVVLVVGFLCGLGAWLWRKQPVNITYIVMAVGVSAGGIALATCSGRVISRLCDSWHGMDYSKQVRVGRDLGCDLNLTCPMANVLGERQPQGCELVVERRVRRAQIPIGALLVVVGAVLGWFSIWSLIVNCRRGASEATGGDLTQQWARLTVDAPPDLPRSSNW